MQEDKPLKDSVLIVDDDGHVVRALRRALDEEGYEIHCVSSGEEGMAFLEKNRVKVVISDERMPNMSGTEFLEKISIRYNDIVRILLTGHASLELVLQVVNTGEVYRVLTKPWNDLELKLALRSAMERYDHESRSRLVLARQRCHPWSCS